MIEENEPNTPSVFSDPAQAAQVAQIAQQEKKTWKQDKWTSILVPRAELARWRTLCRNRESVHAMIDRLL